MLSSRDRSPHGTCRGRGSSRDEESSTSGRSSSRRGSSRGASGGRSSGGRGSSRDGESSSGGRSSGERESSRDGESPSGGRSSSRRGSSRPWHDVTVEDMKAFVGLLIIMGILQLPRLEMHWQTESNLIQTPGISSVISQIRFEQIWRYLHLADNSQDNKTDKLFKVRHFVDLVTAQFSENYTLYQPVTIDEAMIPYKGRLSFKQYMKNKPTKWGIKVFVLSDATNGYIYRLQIYTGKI